MPLEQSSPLVTAEWLADNLDAPDVRVIDATWYLDGAKREASAKAEFDAEHVPGAIFFDIDIVKDDTSPYPHMLPNPIQFTSKVRKLGLGDGNRIVIYDRNRFMASARAWWMFRAMGHLDVFVLDGGLDAWKAIGGALTDEITVPMERHFTPRMRADLIKTLDQMKLAIDNPTRTILDARPPGRFTGEAPEPREGLSSGHMPNARNVPAGSLVDGRGFMRPPEEIAGLVGELSGRVIATCGSGVTASTLALALASLGRDDVAVYDGSWAEWAAQDDCPIETGALHG